MLTIVIGVILFALCIWGANYWCNIGEWKFKSCCAIAAIIFISMLFIAFSPIHGYEEPVLISETELISMSDNEEEQIYVYEFANNVWLYKYVTQGEYVAYDGYYEMNIVRTNVKVTESETCTTPILREYERKAKSGLFAFGASSITEYEFVVPIGTCEKTNIVLN